MPIVRRSTSALGMILANDIKKFMVDNINATKNDNLTPEQGAEMIANAIGYGIAKALSSTVFSTALNAGIIPPGGGVVGSLVNPVLLISTKEV